MSEKSSRKSSIDEKKSCSSEGDSEEEEIEEKVIAKIKALESLPEKVHLIAINNYVIEKRALDTQLDVETTEQETIWREKMEGLLREIGAIVSGTHVYSENDLEGVLDLLNGEEKVNMHNYYTQEPIEDYWKKAMKNHDELSEHIEEIDEGPLSHLLDVKAYKNINKLSLIFTFSENEWFSNTAVTKEFELDGDTINKSWGTELEWKKNFTQKSVTKKNKKKVKKTKIVKIKSFFNLFLAIDPPDEEDSEKNNDQDEESPIEELEIQYEMASTIYEMLPKSLEYYLGLVERMGDFGEDEEGEDY